MVREIADYRYQSFFQWKQKEEHFKLLENSMIFDMTLQEYEAYISSHMQQNILDQIYMTPKIINKDGKTKVLTRRLETFFEQDKDINRNGNIEKAYEYGYSKTEIAAFVGLSSKSVSSILIS